MTASNSLLRLRIPEIQEVVQIVLSTMDCFLFAWVSMLCCSSEF